MMAFFFLYLFIFGASSAQKKDSTLNEHTQWQVRQYIQAVRSNQNTDLNLWALAEISRDQPGIRSYLSSYISDHRFEKKSLSIFEDSTLSYSDKLRRLSFTTSSPVLLIAYLLEEKDRKKKNVVALKYKNEVGYEDFSKINYQAIVTAVLEKQEITSSLLPEKKFHPLHFFLLLHYKISNGTAFSDNYLSSVIQNWSFNHEKSLKNVVGLITLYNTCYRRYDYKEAQKLYQPIIGNPLFPNSLLKLQMLRSLDYSMYRLGYYNRSLEIIRNHSLALANYLGQEKIALKIRVSEGAYLYRIGKIEESKQVYLALHKKMQNQDYPVSKSRLLNNLAINYFKSGETNKYINLLFEALKQAKSEKNYETHLEILKNIFIYYRVNKDFASAKQYLDKAANLAKQKHDNKDLAQINYYEGQVYRDLNKNYDKAIKSFNKSLSLISPNSYYRSYQDIQTEKAALLEKQQKFHEAKAIYDQVLAQAEAKEDQQSILYAQINKAHAFLELSKTDSAGILLDSIKSKNLETLDFYQLVKARTVQARYQQKTGAPQAGIDILQPAIQQILKRSRGTGNLETGFWHVEPEYLDAFELYANLLINAHQYKKAVKTLDALKTINDAALYENPLVRSKVLNEKELSEYKRLTKELDGLRKELLVSRGRKKDAIQQQIDELSAQKSTLDKKINANLASNSISIHRIQQHMSAHERIFHITELNDTYYVATIGRTSIHFKKISLTPELRSHFQNSIRQMATGRASLDNLYQFTTLLGINQLPDYVDKLTIIPDSYLYQLPMDVLPLNPPEHSYSYGEERYVIEKFETRYLTSLNDYDEKSSQDNYRYSFVGYGVSQFDSDRTELVPLPDAQKEIRSIARHLTAFNHKKVYLNQFATEKHFRETAPDAQILHLATHSMVDSQDPMFSSIYLKRSGNKNSNEFSGRIFAYELFELNLSNELIMLNSCESGSGSYLQGTGVVGISRALRYAGAHSLVLNLWSVNDMLASEFAVKFYEGINEGQTKSEALQSAKLYFLRNKNANPHYWGSYMLLGDKGAILKPDRKTDRIVAALFMLFFFTLAAASSVLTIRRRRS